MDLKTLEERLYININRQEAAILLGQIKLYIEPQRSLSEFQVTVTQIGKTLQADTWRIMQEEEITFLDQTTASIPIQFYKNLNYFETVWFIKEKNLHVSNNTYPQISQYTQQTHHT